MTIFSLLLAFVICAIAFAQQEQIQQQQQQQVQQQEQKQEQAKLGSLDVRVNIEGKAFNIRFQPEKESAREMAQQLCTQRGEMIGVTQETLGACVENVDRYLQQAVDRWVAEKVLNVPLTIEGKSFDLSFIPELSDSPSVARNFCTKHSEVLGVTAESLNGCVEPVSTYVQRAVNNFFVEKTLRMPVTIENKTYSVSFLPERHAPLNVAAKLCLEKAEELGITTDEVLQVCAEKVGQNLAKAVELWAESKTLSFPMRVNQQPFTITFMPERKSSVIAAREFCAQHAKELGLTEENAVTSCVTPVTEYVTKQVEKWVESKRLIVPVTVAGETVRLPMFPERESSVEVSQRFCVSNAGAMNLTKENIVDRCISPLNKIVGEAVNAWAQKNAAATAAAAAAPSAPPAVSA